MNATLNQTSRFSSEHQRIVFKPSYHYSALVVSFLIISVNGAVIALFRCRRFLYRTPCNRPLLSLAIADMMTGINTLLQLIPFFEFRYSATRDTFSVSYLFPLNLLTTFLALVSVLHLCSLAAERYLSIFYALRYRSLVTTRKIDYTVAGLWACAFILTTLQLAWKYRVLSKKVSLQEKMAVRKVEIIYSATATSVFAFMPSIILGFVYFRLFSASRSMIRNDPDTAMNVQKKRRRELKHLITYILMYLCFVILCLPYFVVQFIVDIDDKFTVLKEAPIELIEALYMLRTLVSVLNPIIYALLKQDFMKAVKTTFLTKSFWFKVTKRENSNSVPMNSDCLEDSRRRRCLETDTYLEIRDDTTSV